MGRALVYPLLLAVCLAAPVRSETKPSYVLLENGGVIRGSVSFADGRYLISETGAEMRVPPDQVARIAGSLVELYEWRRSQLTAGMADQRLELAEWCIAQKLWPQASRELLEAKAEAPRHRRLELVQRRLAEAWRRAQVGRIEVDRDRLAERQMAEAARAADQLRIAASLPEGSLEHFTRRIQPILVNNCTTAGCHQVGGRESFQLNRNWVHGDADRRSTFANLAAVLAAVDRENPANSPLLRAAADAHGGQAEAALAGARAELHTQVAAWVASTTDPAKIALAANRSTRPSRPAQPPTYSGLIGGGFRPALPVGRDHRFPETSREREQRLMAETRQTSPKADPQVQPAGFVETYEPLTPTPVKRGAQLKPVAPRDEFDPAIFNRQQSAGR